MQGIERNYCNVCINALIGAWRELMEASVVETLQKTRYGKGDTLGLDAITEIIIESRLHEFDRHAILITEELDDQAHRRWPTDSDPIKQPLMFFSDPTDRSANLYKFFKQISVNNDPTLKVGKCLSEIDLEKEWEKAFEPPASITGSTSAITCVRKGEIIFSIILNFITRTIFVSADVGVFCYKLKQYDDQTNESVTLAEIMRNGEIIIFPSIRELKYAPDDCKRFVTFLGKTGYEENFNDSMIFIDSPNQYLHHREPPGPPRALYLSKLEQEYGPIGFILSNGEKIGEWIHWLSFVKYARNEDRGNALRVFEISLERPWTKNGMLMSTSPPYSIFCPNEHYLDISRLRHFERPSQFRCMIVVVPHDNERIIHILQQHKYREVTGSF